MTRELVSVFADRVQLAVERITVSSSDSGVRSAALRWQIGSVSACRRAALRQDPREALIDLWGLSLQQRDFLIRGAGASLFGAEQPAASIAAANLVTDVERIVRVTMAPAVRSAMERVAVDYAERYPITSLDFAREPILPLWLAAAPEGTRITTVGNSPEVLQDVADRVRILGEGVPEALAWRTELALIEHQGEIAEAQALLERLDAGLAEIAALAEKSPELAAEAAAELRRELAPSVARLDVRWGESLATLVAEREAIVSSLERLQSDLAATVASERAAVIVAVAEQRAVIMAEARATASEVTEKAMTQLRATVRDALLLLTLLAAVVLGMPFAAGYFVGRARSRHAAPLAALPQKNQ